MGPEESTGDQIRSNTSVPTSESHPRSSTPVTTESTEALTLKILEIRKNLEKNLEDARIEQAKQEEDIIRRAKQDEEVLMAQLEATRRSSRSSTVPVSSVDAWIFEPFVEEPATANLQAALLLMASVSKDTSPFDGDPRRWPIFIQSFKTMVHDVVLINSQRVMLLKEMLSSDLQHTFSHILSSPLTYQQALKDLWGWYGRPHLVLKAHMEDMKNLPVLQEDDPSALASFYQKIHGTATLLKTAGYGYEMKSSILLNYLVEKLPHHLATDWGHHVRKLLEKHKDVLESAPDIENFDRWLASRVMAERFTARSQERASSSFWAFR